MSDPVKDDVKTEEVKAKTKSRPQFLPWFLVILLIAAIAWIGWRTYGPNRMGDPIGTTLVSFEKQNRLIVFTAEFAPVVSSKDSRFFGALQSRQIAVIPARVDYSVDLSKMDRSRLTWNEETQTMGVRLPAIELSKPNLDEARAKYMREGLWITRDAEDDLSKSNTRIAEREALEGARSPALMELARTSARSAVQQNIAVPLAAAGYRGITVDVSFDGDSAPAPRAQPAGGAQAE
tara:strand:+ start:490 stop:1194 length:705 start_codon:yes stop_codon:yes gene_type:complete